MPAAVLSACNIMASRSAKMLLASAGDVVSASLALPSTFACSSVGPLASSSHESASTPATSISLRSAPRPSTPPLEVPTLIFDVEAGFFALACVASASSSLSNSAKTSARASSHVFDLASDFEWALFDLLGSSDVASPQCEPFSSTKFSSIHGSPALQTDVVDFEKRRDLAGSSMTSLTLYRKQRVMGRATSPNPFTGPTSINRGAWKKKVYISAKAVLDTIITPSWWNKYNLHGIKKTDAPAVVKAPIVMAAPKW
mmetsp:Transcript_121639/g.351112  ORF Transcript_121639/g.351112 Transcript_121639/m.351112 type:complete len:256 (-) Transcript_121639:193-960(-)